LGYVLGFLICNTHLAKYQIVQFELLEGRYLASAVLFMVFTIPPYTVGYLMGESLPYPSTQLQKDHAASSKPRLPVKLMFRNFFANLLGILAILIVLYGGFSFMEMVFEFVSVPSRRVDRPIFLFYCFLVTVVAFFPRFLVWHSVADGRLRIDTMRMLSVPIHLFFLLMVTAIFGEGVYPEISPAYGGGGAWLANIEYKSGVTPPFLMREVVVLDRDSEMITVLSCAGEEQEKRTSLLIRLENINHIEMLDITALSACSGRSRSTPAMDGAPSPSE
jgi:hypothetical protein